MSHRVKLHGLLMLIMSVICQSWSFADELRDPTRPYQYKKQSISHGTDDAAKWRLTSTIIAPNRRVAIINGRRVHRDDLIQGARVISIEAGYVELNHNGNKVVLKLLPATVKSKTKSR